MITQGIELILSILAVMVYAASLASAAYMLIDKGDE